MQQQSIQSEVDQSLNLWKLFNNWTVPFYFTDRIIIVKNNVLCLGSIVQFLTSIANLKTAVELLQQGIVCPREGIFSIIAANQEFMTKSAENWSPMLTSWSLLVGLQAVCLYYFDLHPFRCLHHIKVLEWAVTIIIAWEGHISLPLTWLSDSNYHSKWLLREAAFTGVTTAFLHKGLLAFILVRDLTQQYTVTTWFKMTITILLQTCSSLVSIEKSSCPPIYQYFFWVLKGQYVNCLPVGLLVHAVHSCCCHRPLHW